MFNLNDTMRYFLCPGRTDMCEGISSLCGVVHEKMNSEVRNGDVFIFIGSSRRLMKLLHAEDGGMVMYVKRLEAGRFKLPEYDPESDSYPMEWRDLVMMVEGIQENPEQRLRRLRTERKEYRHLGMKGLTESTLDGWFKKTVELLKPLYEELKREVFSCDYVQADETIVPVINREKHRTDKEYLWMVRSVMEKLAIFHYDGGSRAGAVIESLANQYNFKGYLQCDGFAGYETAFRTNPGVRLLDCLVHIRRHFEQALDENKEMAEHALTQIQHIYRIEHCCDKANLSYDERKAKRRELAGPVMDAMKVWMETEGIKYSPNSLAGKAITYAYTRWGNMMGCLEDGRLLWDNNLAENVIRPITLGRKNYLFCGNHEAAVNMSVICSLLATCKAHDVNPRKYLNDVIARMPYYKKATHGELLELLPHKWKLQHLESVQAKQREESDNRC